MLVCFSHKISSFPNHPESVLKETLRTASSLSERAICTYTVDANWILLAHPHSTCSNSQFERRFYVYVINVPPINLTTALHTHTIGTN